MTDTYDLYDDHAIVHSATSKKDYLVKLPSLECNCVGYGYRQSCRHSELIAQVTVGSRALPSLEPDIPELTPTQQSILDQVTKGIQNA